ncbi:P-type ATPase [Suillus subalutaceus]|uniref:P-type ATPase n=1 Tax=Suillus subalutaceus TaxID=48586 RepID=UPI001B865730|nr:P-type ATPase [Suillus subalutaceus]KAG1829046.1 P-type ATPase [Suillus subalutaceus]
MKSIQSLSVHEAAVIRDGKQQIIEATDIVVGDVAVLNAGDRVPANMHIVQASSNRCFYCSLLMGESETVPGALDATSKNALETCNLTLTSTFVIQGTCHGVVFITGGRTVMGCLVKMLGETKFKLTTI